MSRHFLVVFLVVVGITATFGCRNNDQAAGDSEKLQGTWGAISFVENGQGDKQRVDPELSAVRFVFSGDQITILADVEGASPKGTFKLDPSAKPHQIDMLSMLGIYEVEGDTLKLCYAPNSVKRPAEFKSEPKSEHIFVVFKRIEK